MKVLASNGQVLLQGYPFGQSSHVLDCGQVPRPGQSYILVRLIDLECTKEKQGQLVNWPDWCVLGDGVVILIVLGDLLVRFGNRQRAGSVQVSGSSNCLDQPRPSIRTSYRDLVPVENDKRGL
jgi:hypothetical protein